MLRPNALPFAPGLHHEIRELVTKYEYMVALRRAHNEAKADPAFVEPDPRPHMRSLAARWPGALRELDQLPLATLAQRLAELLRVVESNASVAPWMHAVALFHRYMRQELALSRAEAHGEPRPKRRKVERVLDHIATDLGVSVDEVRALLVFRRRTDPSSGGGA